MRSKVRILTNAINVPLNQTLLLGMVSDCLRFQSNNLAGKKRINSKQKNKMDLHHQQQQQQQQQKQHQQVLEEAEKMKKLTPQQIENELKRRGFLDPTLGICERFYERDPMLAILENPGAIVELPPDVTDPSTKTDADQPEQVLLIDALLEAAHAACSRAFGAKYDNFQLIQGTMENLLNSRNIHAKQFVFLCLLAVEPGLQDALRSRYPRDVENGQESLRLAPMIANIQRHMNDVLNTPFVQTNAVPTLYNADHLIRDFLKRVAGEYKY